MIKAIFVPLQGLARDAQALESAFAVASAFQAHIDCLHVRPDPRLLVAGATAGMETGLGTGVFPAELWNVMVDADKRRAKAAHDAFGRFCKAKDIASDSAVTATFREIEGDTVRDITRNARYSDLVVFANDSLIAETSLDAAGDVIVGSGRPILLTPGKYSFRSLSNVSIAWKETAEAARAVAAAMPLLSKAGAITVLASQEGNAKVEDAIRSADRLANFLKRHGFPARSEHVPHGSKSLPDTILERAADLKSDFLVMGAYGHSRLREFVFGGFTRHVLNETKLPVLLAH